MNKILRVTAFDLHYHFAHPDKPTPLFSLSGYANGLLRVTKYPFGDVQEEQRPSMMEVQLTNRTIRGVKFHPTNPNQFVVSADESFLKLYDVRMFSRSKDGNYRVKPLINYSEHVSTHHIHQINLDPTTGLLVCSGSDNMVRFWNISTGKMVHIFQPFPIVANNYPVNVAYCGDYRLDNTGPRREALLAIYANRSGNDVIRMYYSPSDDIEEF